MRDCFLRRSRENQRYSLRAFARDLEMEPAQLSRVFQGKQKISSGKARNIADRIFDTEAEKEEFVLLVEAATTKGEKARSRALDKLKRITETRPNLSLQALEFLPSWFHIAMMDVLSLGVFGPKQHRELAKMLGISLIEAKIALEALVKAGLVKAQGKRLVKTESRLHTGSGIPSAAIRALHKQFIQKAYEAVEAQSVEQRHFTAKTVSISRADLPKIRALIEDLNRKVSELAAGSRAKDDLYQLNVQCFSLLKEKGDL